MSSEIDYLPSDPTVANRVSGYIPFVDVPSGAPNTLVNADLSQVLNIVAQQYWKADVANHAVIPMTTQEQAAWDAKLAADLLASQRTAAQADIVSTSDLGKLERAVADIIINQLNLHTTWENALAAAVAGAATLAALKTAVAAITPVPTVTLAQAKAAIVNDIGSGGEGD